MSHSSNRMLVLGALVAMSCSTPAPAANTALDPDVHQRYLDQREYCERRMRGEGTVSGSVEGDGILRELTVTVPANPRN